MSFPNILVNNHHLTFLLYMKMAALLGPPFPPRGVYLQALQRSTRLVEGPLDPTGAPPCSFSREASAACATPSPFSLAPPSSLGHSAVWRLLQGGVITGQQGRAVSYV